MFIKLTERLGFNFGFKRYDSNPQMQGVNLLSLNGNDFIDPENIDAYDIYSTTPHLWAVIQRRGDLLASGQWKHYKLVNGQKVEVDNSEIVNTLENPNPLYKGNDYLRLLNENKCGKVIEGNDLSGINFSEDVDSKFRYLGVVENFCWTRQGEKLTNLYLEIINNKDCVVNE
jgi:hypothetical protein